MPSLQQWMSELGFSSVNDGLESGWSPLRFAVMAGHTSLVAELLDKGADVAAPLKRGDSRFAAQPGSTILHLACFIRDDPDMVRLLLARGRTCAGMICWRVCLRVHVKHGHGVRVCARARDKSWEARSKSDEPHVARTDVPRACRMSHVACR